MARERWGKVVIGKALVERGKELWLEKKERKKKNVMGERRKRKKNERKKEINK